MIAFNGNAQLKSDLCEEIRWHREQDRIERGHYGASGDNFRGCAIGCSINSLNRRTGSNWSCDRHSVYPDELGIPLHIAYLEDKIFENMSSDKALDFPLRFMEAVPVGADLSGVWPRMMIFFMRDCRENSFDGGKTAIDQCIALFERLIAGGDVSVSEWDSAARSAQSAARSAQSAAESAQSAAESAESAARSAAWSARSAAWSARSAQSAAESARSAQSAAESAESAESAAESAWSARSAAWSARSAQSAAESAWSAAESAAWSAFDRYADELIRLISEAPVPEVDAAREGE